MIVTPTYWVFEMYKVHQGATFLPVSLTAPNYARGSENIPAVSATASRDRGGKVHLSLANTDPERGISVACELEGLSPKSVSGRVLTAPAINSHNTFDAPNTVRPEPFTGASLVGGKLSVALPSKAVVVLTLE
jgi:alpha-N-arabinofuranosidase